MQATKTKAAKPPLLISETDYDTISDLALRIEQRSPELSGQLLREIDRARVAPRESLPDDVVTLGSEVEFSDEGSGTRRTVRLVLPHDADIEAGRISILTSVGAGLIGMRVGREIDWPRPDGAPRRLKILAVNQRPEPR
jgi:regulator of nucleoside diphosphate kinase